MKVDSLYLSEKGNFGKNMPKIRPDSKISDIKDAVSYAFKKIHENRNDSVIKIAMNGLIKEAGSVISKQIKDGRIGMKELNEFRQWIDTVANNEKQLNENVDQAEVLVAAKALSGDIQNMYEKVAKMVATDLIYITEEIKNKFGEDQAKAFYNLAKSNLEGLTDTLQASYEELSGAADDLSSGTPISSDSDMMDYDSLGGDDSDDEEGDTPDLDSDGTDAPELELGGDRGMKDDA